MNHEKQDECIFCHALQQTDGCENLIIAREKHAFVILNRYPYTSGHLMVVPFAHQPAIEKLDADIRAEIMELLTAATRVLQEVYRPEGFNIGANIGSSAGAGVANHVHFHLVPRWGGDTNFFSTVAETRVLPEALPETYRRIKSAWPG